MMPIQRPLPPSTRALSGPHRLVIVLLAVTLVAASQLAAPVRTLAWDPGSFSPESETSLVALHNQARAAAGLRALKADSTLRSVARWRAKDMAERDYFSHNVKCTDRNVFWYTQYEYGYCFKIAGENLGTVAWDGASEPEATRWVFNAWMESEGHRANVLGKSWDAIGIGAYRGAGGKFVWTALFADECGSAASTPKPAPKPTAKPAATQRVTPMPTPRPTPEPTPRPTEKPSPTASPEDSPQSAAGSPTPHSLPSNPWAQSAKLAQAAAAPPRSGVETRWATRLAFLYEVQGPGPLQSLARLVIALLRIAGCLPAD